MRVTTPIPLELDKPRSLLLTLPALKAIEDMLAKVRGEKRVNIFKLFESGDLGAQEILVVLWAGLRHEDPKLTLDQALALVAHCSLQEIAEAVRAALQQHVTGGSKPEAAPPETADGDAPPLA